MLEASVLKFGVLEASVLEQFYKLVTSVLKEFGVLETYILRRLVCASGSAPFEMYQLYRCYSCCNLRITLHSTFR